MRRRPRVGCKRAGQSFVVGDRGEKWVDPHGVLRLHRAARPGRAGGCIGGPAHNGGWVADPVWGTRPLAAHGPARFQPARKSQVWAGGNARSGAPADEYGST